VEGALFVVVLVDAVIGVVALDVIVNRNVIVAVVLAVAIALVRADALVMVVLVLALNVIVIVIVIVVLVDAVIAVLQHRMLETESESSRVESSRVESGPGQSGDRVKAEERLEGFGQDQSQWRDFGT